METVINIKLKRDIDSYTTLQKYLILMIVENEMDRESEYVKNSTRVGDVIYGLDMLSSYEKIVEDIMGSKDIDDLLEFTEKELDDIETHPEYKRAVKIAKNNKARIAESD